MDYSDFVAKRLSDLRIQKGISARDMSLSIGQSAGYINKIENRQNLPSMQGFFYICEYLNITPQDFFDDEKTSPQKLNTIVSKLSMLSYKQLEAIDLLLDAMQG